MSESMDRLITWCRTEREMAAQALHLLEEGKMETRSKTLGEDWVDTTQQDADRARRTIAAMDDIIGRLAPGTGGA